MSLSTQFALHDEVKLKQRLKSYATWTSPRSYILLASAGFRYTGDLDRVQCDYCNKKVVQWTVNDDPIEVHSRFAPDCVFLKHLGYSGKPRLPRFSKLSSCHDRLISVRTVPEEYHTNLPSFESIAEAGFFYHGTLDRMICYDCGLILKDWQPTTDPLLTHKRFRNTCYFIINIFLQRAGVAISADRGQDNEILMRWRESSLTAKVGRHIKDNNHNWHHSIESANAACISDQNNQQALDVTPQASLSSPGHVIPSETDRNSLSNLDMLNSRHSEETTLNDACRIPISGLLPSQQCGLVSVGYDIDAVDHEDPCGLTQGEETDSLDEMNDGSFPDTVDCGSRRKEVESDSGREDTDEDELFGGSEMRFGASSGVENSKISGGLEEVDRFEDDIYSQNVSGGAIPKTHKSLAVSSSENSTNIDQDDVDCPSDTFTNKIDEEETLEDTTDSDSREQVSGGNSNNKGRNIQTETPNIHMKKTENNHSTLSSDVSHFKNRKKRNKKALKHSEFTKSGGEEASTDNDDTTSSLTPNHQKSPLKLDTESSRPTIPRSQDLFNLKNGSFGKVLMKLNPELLLLTPIKNLHVLPTASEPQISSEKYLTEPTMDSETQDITHHPTASTSSNALLENTDQTSKSDGLLDNQPHLETEHNTNVGDTEIVGAALTFVHTNDSTVLTELFDECRETVETVNDESFQPLVPSQQTFPNVHMQPTRQSPEVINTLPPVYHSQAFSDLPMVQAVLNMGVTYESIVDTVNQRYSAHGDTFIDATSLLSSIYDSI